MHSFLILCENCQPHFFKKTDKCKYCNKAFKPSKPSK